MELRYLHGGGKKAQSANGKEGEERKKVPLDAERFERCVRLFDGCVSIRFRLVAGRSGGREMALRLAPAPERERRRKRKETSAGEKKIHGSEARGEPAIRAQ